MLLLERPTGTRSLAAMARAGGDSDDEATRILCAATRRLHDHRAQPPSGLVPLDEWFAPLLQATDRGALIDAARDVADTILSEKRETVVLHGDIHHENVLDAGSRGWLVIDPKGLLGDLAFDYMNLLRNPDGETALIPGRFARQADVIARASELDRTRLLQWTLAFAALSAVWILGEGDTPTLDLAVAQLASVALES